MLCANRCATLHRMPLPTIGESLDPAKTLESLSRKLRTEGWFCRKCRSDATRRGIEVNTQSCWWCTFPRKG